MADYIAANVEQTVEQAVADYLTANPPPAGDDGREVQLQTTATHVQWRYSGDVTWLDLIPLSIISGSDGLSAELRTNATHVQWRQAGGAWADLIPLASLIGPTGPANTLTLGTVTTLPAGAPATAAITGTAPNQTLGLGIPMGLTGAASDWLKVGPGDPRTPATTSGQITGTEPNGCTYVSTDGGGVGGYRWTKRAGVWVCVEGDTGWRTAYAWLENGWAQWGTFPLLVNRTANRVSLSGVLTGAAKTSNVFMRPTSGFRIPTLQYIQSLVAWNTGTNAPVTASTTTLYADGAVAGAYSAGALSWLTANAWPTTLPGSPA